VQNILNFALYLLPNMGKKRAKMNLCKTSLAWLISTLLPTYSLAYITTQTSPPKHSTVLIIKKYPFIINGKATELFKIEQPNGAWGYHGVKGQYFDAIVKNATDKPTVIHWHGLILPNPEDGVPYVTQPPILPGGEHHYRFKLSQSGTYWMHSHFDLQVQRFLSAPFIISDPNEKTKEKEVILFLGDFSYKKPIAILYGLKNSGMIKVKEINSSKTMSPAKDTKPDLNDVTYDAFLTNYHTLSKPQIVPVKGGETIRLRIIDGAAMTNFFIDTKNLQGKAIAIDGQPIKIISGTKFQLAVGQRIDIRIKIPEGEGTYPIIAQGAGTQLQTGLILTTKGGKNIALSEKAPNVAGGLDYQQELKIEALSPLPIKKPEQTLNVSLEGNMIKYVWTINNQAWPNMKPLSVDKNKRVELIFINKTEMAHPMHLHGHIFEVTEIDGKTLKNGAMRDTVLVLPHSTVKIQFDTDNPGNWMLHCHMLYHEATGMMTFINYNGVNIPDVKKKIDAFNEKYGPEVEIRKPGQ
jgi:FtsP/CotA-like multicopper oxidase with cupredoxin domain